MRDFSVSPVQFTNSKVRPYQMGALYKYVHEFCLLGVMKYGKP